MAPATISDKGARYISQLDVARCNGRWVEVAEIARKVEKHAPTRQCLVATAKAEAKVATQPINRPGTAARPSTAKAENGDKTGIPIIRDLEAAIGHEKSTPEDRYQAQTCLAWFYWNNSEYSKAKAVVPHDIPAPSNGTKISDWTTVCIVRAAFFRASSEEGLQNLKEVPTVYEAALQNLESLPAPTLGVAEFCFWWERFFNRCCGCFYGLFQERTKTRRRNVDTRVCLQAFRAWSSNWDQLAGTMTTASDAAKQKRSQRLLVWKSYHDVLSQILQYGYTYPSPVSTEALQYNDSGFAANHRKLLFIELSRVETHYEAMLLKQVSFPKASETNDEVNEWVGSIMANWRITCGSGWQEEDLGRGGRSTASRKLLESLYRAATLTFHSTLVLRHLFTVHATLAEFMLAEKALDSYLEIVTKGKARVKKSGIEEPELDSDEIMLQTLANGIEMLCEFGRRPQIEKSVVLADNLLNWLNEFQYSEAKDEYNKTSTIVPRDISPLVQATVHRAIAISKASWARMDYESKDRSKLQADAVKHMKIALKTDQAIEEDPSFLYPLALILAETRNIEGAVAVIKQALTTDSSTSTAPLDVGRNSKSTITNTAGPQVESWHLLSLLLSSRQEFETAETATQTALEKYDNAESTATNHRGLPFFQKKQIIEAKMTQISLAEISGGSQDAVNASVELIALYSRLFDRPKTPVAKPDKPPPTAAGTIKSFRGSIFGRHRKSVRSSMVSLPRIDPAEEEPVPPTIAVTGDGSNIPLRTLSQAPTRSPSQKLQKRRSRLSMRRSRAASPAGSAQPLPLASPSITSETTAGGTNQLRPGSTHSNNPSEVGIAVTHDYPTVQTAQAISFQHGHALRLESNGDGKSTRSQDNRNDDLEISESQKSIPRPIFSPEEEQKYSIALLNAIWLFVASLYRKGDLLEDARQAMDEAFKQAKIAEKEAASPGPSSAKAFEESGWGGVKSIEEIWADSYAEMGHLCLAEGDPYEAMLKYESALSHFPDHADAIVALANILLDIHSRKLPLSRKQTSLAGEPRTKIEDDSSLPLFSKVVTQTTKTKPQPNGVDSAIIDDDDLDADHEPVDEPHHIKTSEELDLLASRDRAYTLLSNLTKLGTGWDDSDAWFALAHAYEVSGQTEKAKEVLWWVVELEEKRPVRHWRVLGQGYKLQR